ncbi:MAG: C40 family peptidase [Bacteroidota bacterium]
MSQKISCLFLFLLLASSCVVKKKTTYSKTRTVSVKANEETTAPKKNPKKKTRKNTKADAVITTALTYSGVRYSYGGTTRKGMDCSGLLYVSFKQNDIPFPRVSHEMANEGRKIPVKNVQKGDLLFFKTSKKGKRVNHVGLVVDVVGNDIKFIHSTTSRGVIVSSLREGFWNHSFVKATRIL